MKKILLIIIFVLFGFIGMNKINAGSLSINGSSSVYVNSSVTVTVNFNNIAGRFRIYSSDSSVLSGGAEDFYDNQKVTVTFAATKAGTATIYVAPIGRVGDYDNEEYLGGSRAITIKVVNKNTSSSVNVNKTYDKNNYLKSLSIDGYTLSPSFNKDTLDYSVVLAPGTEKINVTASLESNKSKIKGNGEVSVSEGINTIEVVVTAENGNERHYVITASVEEKDPIEVVTDGKKYRVVKKEDLISDKDGYQKVEITINNFNIPALYNEVTKVYLVGLKNELGEIVFYQYDTKTGEYSNYQELKFDIMNLYIHEPKTNKYEKISTKINGYSVPAYKINGVNDYYLLYATNTLTGYEGYYLYDTKENSVQRYSSILLDQGRQEKNKYFILIIVLGCISFLSMLFLLIRNSIDNKKSE